MGNQADNSIEKEHERLLKYFESWDMTKLSPVEVFQMGSDYGVVEMSCAKLSLETSRTRNLGIFLPVRSTHQFRIKKLIEDRYGFKVDMTWLNDDYVQLQIHRRIL